MSPHLAASIPAPVGELCDQLRRAGYRAWLVGGGLRDLLMQRSPKDWDLATDATPPEMKKVFRRVIPTGIAHGTVTVLHRGEPYEVTTLRGEGAYSDGRRPDSVYFVRNIEDDLARRDFTVNAIAYDPLTDRLIDPFGGLQDMRARRLRTVGSAEERFGEDGLRVLRAARFVATLAFDLDPATEAGIAPALRSFECVSRERVRDEWLKAMAAEQPSRAFEVMRRTGILTVTCPELMKQVGCAQNRYHAYDVWGHSMACMDACGSGPIHRVAGLLHDIGKPQTRALSDKTQDFTFYNHEAVGAEMADDWLREYRFSNDERRRVVQLVRHHLICYSSDWTDAAVRRFIKRVGDDHLEDLLALGRADVQAKGRPVEEELRLLIELEERIATVRAAGSAMGVRDLTVSGKDVIRHLNIRPGPLVGRVLDALLERVLDDPELNQKEALLELSEKIVEREGEGPDG
ncbi:MAG: HDIG domain-containing protein [Myxococcales bacterium]|nr:HDIG domain-containing protein [Myxococcales bacterium]